MKRMRIAKVVKYIIVSLFFIGAFMSYLLLVEGGMPVEDSVLALMKVLKGIIAVAAVIGPAYLAHKYLGKHKADLRNYSKASVAVRMHCFKAVAVRMRRFKAAAVADLRYYAGAAAGDGNYNQQ